MSKVRRFAVKLIVFTYRKFLLLLTWLRRFPDHDPTQILLDWETPEQRHAYGSLSAISLPEKTKVLAIVPFRDKWQLTQNCLRGLFRQELDNCQLQIVLVDNGSQEPATEQGLSQLTPPTAVDLKIVQDPRPFNFSRLMNSVVKSHGQQADLLWLLNNDIEIPSHQTLRHLWEFTTTTDNCGAVGTTLLYPYRHIQHLFVAPGVAIMGAHPFSGLNWQSDYAWFQQARPVAAVTGASLMVKTADYLAVEGLDEDLPHSGQDVDFCLKLQRLGCVNWALSRETLIHHESASRSKALSLQDSEYLYNKWGDFLTANPYYNRNFSRWSERPVVSLGEGAFPWRAYCR